MHRASLAALILTGSAAFQGATAQSLSESVLTATISQSVEADSNYDLEDKSPGTTYLGDTRFELGLTQESQNHILLLGFDTGLRALDRPDDPFEFTLASPTGALLDYEYEAVNATFDALVRYRQRRTTYTRDLSEFVTDEGFLPDDLEDDDRDANAREYRLDGDIGFRYGTSAPSTYGLRFTGTNIDYSNDSSNLTPRQQAQVTGDWTLRFTPVLSTIVVAQYFYYKAENSTNTKLEIIEGDAGLVYEPDENLRLRGGVGVANRKRHDTFLGERGVTEDKTGVTLRGDILYIQDDLTVAGDGRFTTAATDPRFSFNLTGNYALPRGRLTGRIFNRYTGASESGTEARVSGVGIGLIRDINNVSRFGLDFAYAHQEQLDSDESDLDRGAITARYIRDITRVVNASVGYSYRKRIQDPDNADSHRVFFTIGRTFETSL